MNERAYNAVACWSRSLVRDHEGALQVKTVTNLYRKVSLRLSVNDFKTIQ